MNRLSLEHSPYLQQHQHNPVDWYPWGDEAFRKAKEENKPIFLSIGYSTCHWCHVMERESFENEQIAALMNRYFVNIKVDREERPDVDRVYMSAVQTMVGHGGWPLSVFLTPDLKPFYGGTYFPPKDAHGRPGFPTLLERIHEVWEKERENVIHSGDELTRQLQHRHPVNTGAAEVDATILKRTYHQIAAGYDPKNAGFGTGTKFPRPVVFNFLFRYYHRTGDQEALKMSLTTLMAMASGGMADHLGGGFHRYSVDPQWRVPHFEKMLYDQAQLVHSYLDAWQITGDRTFAAIAQRTVDYVLREMTSPDGAFCSAEDADSDDPGRPGHPMEGAFYVWTRQEIDRLLTEEESRVFCLHYSIEPQGNVQHDPHHEFEGKNILFNPFTPEQTAQQLGWGLEKVNALLSSAEGKLFEARNSRPRPLRDDKVLTSWNGLMIGACARAAFVLGNDAYRAAAEQAAQFILSRMMDAERHTLSRRYRNGEAKFDAHLEDYAAMIEGVLELFRTTSELRWLRSAEELAGTMVTLFWDSAEGGFYDTSGKDPSVLVRTKEAYDGAEPTGNALAAGALLRLYHLTNDERYRQYAERTIRYFCVLLDQSPQIMPQMMAVVEQFLMPPQHLVIAGGRDEHRSAMVGEVRRVFLPHCSFITLTPENSEWLSARFPFMRTMLAGSEGATAYLCTDHACQLPAKDPETLRRQLAGR